MVGHSEAWGISCGVVEAVVDREDEGAGGAGVEGRGRGGDREHSENVDGARGGVCSYDLGRV